MCEAGARIGVQFLMLGADDAIGAEIMSRWGKNEKRTDDAGCAGAEMIICVKLRLLVCLSHHLCSRGRLVPSTLGSGSVYPLSVHLCCAHS